jgi:hypothetical protein
MVLKRIAIGMIVAILVGIALCPIGTMVGLFWFARHRRVSLLCRTDHHALLDACRELSKRVASGNLEPGRMYHVLFDADPEAATFPPFIRKLKPTFVFVDRDGRVVIEMMGGLDHFGVSAYPEGYQKPSADFEFGDEKLIDGLWYNDDGYDANPEGYDKRIEALRRKTR